VFHVSEPKADIENHAADASPGSEPLNGGRPPRSNGNPVVSPASIPSESTILKKPDATQPVAITDLKDRQLGDFKLLRRIGKGGMAEVYLAEQTTLKRNVAVKVLREEMLTDDVHLKRFEQEAKAAGGLNHPNIVQVYTIGHEGGVHYIAQEYVQGMNLREYLNRHGPPGLELALRFMMQAASALQAASDAGVVHRDIKPENILITRKDEVKITDFGLAQLTLPGENLHLTQVGMTMGTPLYMSPEQVNGRKIDRRSDLYSLGVTCYHMLCGVTPFRGETALSVAIQHVNADPPPLKQQRPDLPDIVCRVIHRLMSKNPDDRYQDAETLLTDLNRIAETYRTNPSALAKLRLTETTVAGIGPVWLRPFLGWSWRRHVLTFVATAASVAAIAAAIGWRSRLRDPFQTEPAADVSDVPIMPTAMDQYFRAFQIGDEASYRAVIDHFKDPKDRRIRLRAKEALAMIYLRGERYADAEKIYHGFTIEDDTDEILKAKGYAGLAAIAFCKGKYRESQEIIVDNKLLTSGRLANTQLGTQTQDISKRNLEMLQDRRKKIVPEKAGGTPTD
jgi:eukaryotic-like serine/threonine-protein kinase